MTLSRKIFSVLLLNLFALGLWAQETGKADIFSDEFQGSWTASQTTYNKDEFVAAHKSYEFGTILKVMVAGQDRAINVRVVDRGPFKHGYIVTLSRAAANELGLKDDDTRDVTIFVAKEQGLATSPQITSQNAIIAKTSTQTTVTTPQTTVTTVQPQQEFASKGQTINIESPQAQTTVVTSPTTTVITTAPKVMSSNMGYGLQVGSFIDYNNAMAEMSKLQNNNISNLVLNSVVDNQGRTVYKLIIGPYADRVEVEQYKNTSSGRYNSNAFIVDLSKM